MGNSTVRISADRQQMMVDLYEGGMSRLGVARAVGTSIETVNKFLSQRGVEFRPHYSRKIPPGEFETISERYKNGEHVAILAQGYGCTDAVIRKVLDRTGTQRRDDRGHRREYTEDEIVQIRRMAAEGASQKQIAQALGSAQVTVSKLMRQAGIPPAYTGPARRERHGQWTGGRTLHPSGYWQLRLDRSDPLFSMTNRAGCVMEHRVVMARSLGRPLTARENIHHLNGDRTDNRLENLELWERSQPSGQRPHEKGARYVCLDCGSTNVASARLAAGS